MAALIASPQLLDDNDTWDTVDAMLEELLSPAFRAAHADGRGEPTVLAFTDHDFRDLRPDAAANDLAGHTHVLTLDVDGVVHTDVRS